MIKRIVLVLMILVMGCSAMAAGASEPVVTEIALDLMGSSIRYPQVSGLADASVQAAVNAAIMEAGSVEARINRMTMLMTSPVKMTVTSRHTLAGDVFSCAFLADGAVENTRSTQIWSSVNVNLSTGEAIGLTDLFTDAEAALAHIESYLTETVAPEQSAHLAAGNLLPVPETFSLSREGLTLYYPIRQFRTLSDRAGTVTLLWTELRDYLNLTAGSPLDMLRVPATLTLDAASARESLAHAVSGGSLPGIPATIGQSVQELTDTYRQLTDNELCEAGRMFILEDGAFRGAWVITDALTDRWDKSVVNMIRADRLNLLGLCTGHTTVEAWRQALGAPDATVPAGETQAERWRIVPGASDYYTLGDYRLRLHADADGVLRSVFLMK